MTNQKNLADIQNEFFLAIHTANNTSSLASIILEKPPISTTQRMKIYQDAYRIRLLESLKDDFYKVVQKIGETEFDRIAWEHIQQNPSTTRNLAEYSASFVAFLRLNYAVLFEDALQDWLEILAAHAPEPELATILSAQEIADGQSFAIKTHPATQIAQGLERYFISYRNGDETFSLCVSAIEAELLHHLQTAHALDDLALLAQSLQILDEQLQVYLATWIKEQIIYCQRR